MEKSEEVKEEVKTVKPENKSLDPAIENVFKNKGYKLFPYPKIESLQLDCIAISHKTVILCLVYDEPGKTTIKQSDDPSVPTQWFSTNSKQPSPVEALEKAMSSIKELMNEVLPSTHGIDLSGMVVITQSEITNADQMQQTWQEKNVQVYRFQKGSPATLPELTNLQEKNAAPPSQTFTEFVETMIRYFDYESTSKKAA